MYKIKSFFWQMFYFMV